MEAILSVNYVGAQIPKWPVEIKGNSSIGCIDKPGNVVEATS